MTSTLDPNVNKGWLDEDQSTSNNIIPPKKKFKLFGGENASFEDGRRNDSSPLVVDTLQRNHINQINSPSNSTHNTPNSTPSTPNFSTINARIQTLTTPKHGESSSSPRTSNHRNGENHKTIEHNKNMIDCSPFSLFGNSTIDKHSDSPRLSNGNHSKPSTPLISQSTVTAKHQSPPLLITPTTPKEEKLKKENTDTVKNEGEGTPSSFRKKKRRVVETSESDSSSSSGSDSNSSDGEEDDPLSKKATQKEIERREKLWENLKQQLKDSNTSTRKKKSETTHASALSSRRKREQDPLSDSAISNGNLNDHASNSSISVSYSSESDAKRTKKNKRKEKKEKRERKEKKEKKEKRESKSESDRDDSKNGWMHHFGELRKLKQGDGSFKLKSSTFMYRWLHNQVWIYIGLELNIFQFIDRFIKELQRANGQTEQRKGTITARYWS
eukprot:TRINITY_DN3416_c0_g1_i1.p1 TRINITY_DN3416_c0_g1~~TRINITY_DN3416_c0_g1_i1.p1  ORF type:complete len:442 (-),score=141.61 TRINITY_DN3416_c0_g1_i1:786-2111(-)